MKLFAATAAIAVALSAPAFANDQLAASLGVEPGVYTTSELAALRNAKENDDHQAYRNLLRADDILLTSGGLQFIERNTVSNASDDNTPRFGIVSDDD